MYPLTRKATKLRKNFKLCYYTTCIAHFIESGKIPNGWDPSFRCGVMAAFVSATSEFWFRENAL